MLNKFAQMRFSLFLFLAASCAQNEPSASQLNMRGGVEDYTSSPGVVGLLIKSPGAPTGSFCTGTVVRDDLILTAAHCFGAAQNLEVYPYQKLKEEGRFRPLVARGFMSNQIVQHPRAPWVGLGEGYLRLEVDVAFVVFEPGTFKYWSKESIASKSVNVGEKVKLIGYGHTETQHEVTGKRMSGISAVAAIRKENGDAIQIDTSILQKEAYATPLLGDSGGPLLNVAGEVVGVLQGEVGYRTYYVNINSKKIRPFIDAMMNNPSPLNATSTAPKSSTFEDSQNIKSKIKTGKPPLPPGHDELK